MSEKKNKSRTRPLGEYTVHVYDAIHDSWWRVHNGKLPTCKDRYDALEKRGESVRLYRTAKPRYELIMESIADKINDFEYRIFAIDPYPRFVWVKGNTFYTSSLAYATLLAKREILTYQATRVDVEFWHGSEREIVRTFEFSEEKRTIVFRDSENPN